MKKAAIYCRVSSDRQREKSTIESQKEILPKLVVERDFQLVETYIDDGISGETIEARPGFSQLLVDADLGKFAAIFVIDYDRITRTSDDFQRAYIKKIFKTNGIAVHTPSQVYDFANEENDLLSGMMELISAHEKRKIISRTKRGRREKWRRGIHAHGIVPFGYRWSGKAYEIIEEEGRIVKLIYDLALEGMGQDAIAKALNDRGELTPTDLRGYRRRRIQPGWCQTMVERILQVSTYYGDMTLGITESKNRKLTKRPQSEWIVIKVPEIVTRGEFDRVRQIRFKNRTFSGITKYPFLLSKLLRCGECGSSLLAESRYMKGSYVCWQKRKKRPGHEICILPRQPRLPLEETVWTAVLRLIDEPYFLKEEIRKDFESKVQQTNTGLDRETLEKMILGKQMERERVLTLFRKGKISSDQVDSQFANIDGEEVILKRNLDLINNRERIERSLIQNLDQIDSKLVQVRSRIHHLSFEEKKKLLQVLTYDEKPGITIHKNGEIELRGLFNFENTEDLVEKVNLLVGA